MTNTNPYNDEESERKRKALEQSSKKPSPHTQPTTIHSTNENISSDGKLNIPKKDPIEKKKTYTFSLKPSVRENIEKMAHDNNYASSSELLNTLFKQ